MAPKSDVTQIPLNPAPLKLPLNFVQAVFIVVELNEATKPLHQICLQFRV